MADFQHSTYRLRKLVALSIVSCCHNIEVVQIKPEQRSLNLRGTYLEVVITWTTWLLISLEVSFHLFLCFRLPLCFFLLLDPALLPESFYYFVVVFPAFTCQLNKQSQRYKMAKPPLVACPLLISTVCTIFILVAISDPVLSWIRMYHEPRCVGVIAGAHN